MNNFDYYKKEVAENTPILNKISKLDNCVLVQIFEKMLKQYCVNETYNKLIENESTANHLSMEFDPVNVIHVVYTKSFYDSIKITLSAYSCSVHVKKEHGGTNVVFSMPFKHFVKIYCNEENLSK
jgi:poly(A) polymerase Pap1